MNTPRDLLRQVPRAWLHELTRSPGPPRGAQVVVAVSGGGDSVALLHLLVALAPGRGWNLSVASFDHRWRGNASAADRDFVATLAEQFQLPFDTAAAATPAATRRNETEARQERHAFLAGVAAQRGAATIALAHTRDDQAETLLYRLARGSGARGLSAMARWAPPLWRPLLALERVALRDWLRQLPTTWREDATNDEPHTPRNRLRAELLPLLADLMGRPVSASLARAADLLREDEALLTDLAREAGQRSILRRDERQLVLDRRSLTHLPSPLLRRILRDAFLDLAAGLALECDHLSAVEALVRATSPGTACDLPAGWRAERRSGELWLWLHDPRKDATRDTSAGD